MDKDTIVLVLLITLIFLSLAPRRYVRKIRSYPSRFVFWQWKKMGRISAVVYSVFYDLRNGNNHDD